MKYLTITVPCFNSEEYLKRCLDSLIAGGDDVEIIVVNDGSTDRTGEIYIAVDMLPVPGAQGITEAMYKAVFKNVFPADCLVASICITRGISFYLVMAVSFIVWGIVHLQKNKYIYDKRKEEN